jgi:hypothetical protein
MNSVPSEVKAFLKFGEFKDLEKFKNSSVYFGKAEHYRELEKQIKGQGDKREGAVTFPAVKATLYDKDGSGRICHIDGPINILAVIPELNRVPIFCLFAVYDKDIQAGKIVLSKEIRSTIRSHFPKANAVAVVKNPVDFNHRLTDKWEYAISTGYNVESDIVHYFNLEGYDTVDPSSGKVVTAVDERYLDYLRISKAYNVKTAYKTLFAKDEFFQNEQEYRYVIPKALLPDGQNGVAIKANVGDLIELENLDEFFDRMT